MGYRWIRAAVVVVGWWCRASVVVQDKVVSMVSHPRIRGSTKLHSPSSDMFFARRYPVPYDDEASSSVSSTEDPLEFSEDEDDDEASSSVSIAYIIIIVLS
ncbi:hypothetical protein HanIR_Chr16g0823121 [Helianthus annuus]|nr:hypothetical protein HanIR_Chr16g0823121 [Helianthus annuus]